MEVPKEGKEVIDATAAITKHFVNGGSVLEAAALLPAVMKAVEGVDGVKEEIKSQYKDELAAYAVHRVWESLEKDETPIEG